jgi:hypothetical protein
MPAKWKGKGLRTFATLLTALIALAAPAQAENDRAGVFDYYVLALSWSPSWCALEGDAREAAQCAPGKGLGFTLHGLWPQHERGWPDYCRSDKSDPSRRQSGAMADIMGDGGLAWHQWKKHGRCVRRFAASVEQAGGADPGRPESDRASLPRGQSGHGRGWGHRHVQTGADQRSADLPDEIAGAPGLWR